MPGTKRPEAVFNVSRLELILLTGAFGLLLSMIYLTTESWRDVFYGLVVYLAMIVGGWVFLEWIKSH